MKKILIFHIIYCSLGLYGTDLRTISTINNEEFYKLRKIAVSDNGIFVLDVGNQTVFQYSIRGKLLRSISEPGQGPGEFIEPVDIIVDQDTLWILGHTLMRIGKFVNGQYENSFQMEKMPISFCKLNNQFVVGDVFSSTFLSRYSINGTLLDSTSFQGAAKKKYKGTPFPLFSTLTYMTSSDSHIYLTYMYKNAIEKYGSNLKLVKPKKISKKIKEPKVKKGADYSYYIEGETIAKDIYFYDDKVYVLWMNQVEQIECEGLSNLSIFNKNLKLIETLTLPDCVVGLTIYKKYLYGVCNEPYPQVVIYEIN